MRVLNSSSSGFYAGKLIVVHKQYKRGSIRLNVGDVGIVRKITYESLLYFGLSNIKVIYMKFGSTDVAMAEHLAKEYFKPGKKL